MGPTHMDFTWTCTRTQPNLRVVDAQAAKPAFGRSPPSYTKAGCSLGPNPIVKTIVHINPQIIFM